jgi:hypothetical protein
MAKPNRTRILPRLSSRDKNRYQPPYCLQEQVIIWKMARRVQPKPVPDHQEAHRLFSYTLHH